MSEFEPELGQMVFGQPHKRYKATYELESAMECLCAIFDGEGNPFQNSGASADLGVFKVEAYSWSDDEQPWNFKWRDLEVSWYKYVGRGMSVNREISKQEIVSMMIECLSAIASPRPLNT